MDHHQPQLEHGRRQQQTGSPGPLVTPCTVKDETGVESSSRVSACLSLEENESDRATMEGTTTNAAAVETEDSVRKASRVAKTHFSSEKANPTTTATIMRQRPRIWTSRERDMWKAPELQYCNDDDDDNKKVYECHSLHFDEEKESMASSPWLSWRILLFFSALLIGGFTISCSLSDPAIVITSEHGYKHPQDRHRTIAASFSEWFEYLRLDSKIYRNSTATPLVDSKDDPFGTSTLRGAVTTLPKSNTAPQSTRDFNHRNHQNNNVTKQDASAFGTIESGTDNSNYLVKFLPIWPSSLLRLFDSFSSPSVNTTHPSGQSILPLMENQTSTPSPRKRRALYSKTSSGSSSSSSSSFSSGHSSKRNTHEPQLVIAGKMTVDDALCNIAQYNLKTKEWSLTERIQLSLYNSYSGGEVYSLLANHTNRLISTGINPATVTRTGSRDKTNAAIISKSNDNPEGNGELIVVGAFDTTYRNSQVTYCSVGKWNGYQLSKVGEGLCNSALSKGMKITTAAMAGPQDVYAAGSFQTQVWNGDRHEFVKIYNIAHYNAAGKEGPVWLPLDIGQITCSWCTVTVLALAWDSTRRQLHVAGKFNSIDGRNVPAGLAIYDLDSGRLLAHPGGGLAMKNRTEDGVGTALQLDEEKGVLYVMGSFQRLTANSELCDGLAAYDISSNHWTCLANPAHTVQPTGGGNMILTPYGLMVAGQTSGEETTWEDKDRPYTIALLHTTLKTHEIVNETSSSAMNSKHDDKSLKKNIKNMYSSLHPMPPTKSSGSASRESNEGLQNSARSELKNVSYHEFEWSWLPGFSGNDEPLHALSNGFGDYEGSVFIAGDNLVAMWSYKERSVTKSRGSGRKLLFSSDNSGQNIERVAVTEIISTDHVRGAAMAISQMQLMPDPLPKESLPSDIQPNSDLNIRISITLAVGCLIGILGAVVCNRKLSSKLFPCFGIDFSGGDGIPLDTLSNSTITDAYMRAMKTRYVETPTTLTLIDPQEIFLQRIIGEGNFGRVWSARWKSSSVAVKEFVFAQAAVIGKSSMQQQIVEEIIGEAGMMAILRHPNVLQLFGVSLTAQAIWIVSELCSLGSLRQVLDDNDRPLPDDLKVNLALQVAEGMSYLHNQDPLIIHRDLKSHNIFVHETFIDTDQDGDSNINGPSGDGQINKLTLWRRPQKIKSHSALVAKIGDWGSARATLSGSRTMTHGVGTACWLAPEVIKNARCSKYSDVYGYGIILWEMSTRDEVYKGLESTQIIAKVANEGLRPPVPNHCVWSDVMTRCWAENPQDRLGFNEVVVELNRISRKLDEDREKGMSKSLINQNQQRLEDIAEETPLINVPSNISLEKEKENSRKLNIFSNMLRHRK